MNYNQIKSGLTGFDTPEIDRYINYLKYLETEKEKDGTLKNKWFVYFKEKDAIDIYTKVAIDNLCIDGETITLQFKGRVMVSYNYQAYKNRLLNIYPESMFDIQIVNDGDEFSFHKENGKVIYSHKIKDPFNPSPKIIGTYCIIKNKRGEFLETLNMTDIEKMKSVAKTKNVWDQWFSEMVLKSVIKRACKRHFADITTNIEKIDNENYDLNLVDFDSNIEKKINEATDFKTLSKIFKDEKSNVTDEVKFVRLLTDRKIELMELLPEIKPEDHEKAINLLKSGRKPDDLLMIWKIDEDTKQDIISKAL